MNESEFITIKSCFVSSEVDLMHLQYLKFFLYDTFDFNTITEFIIIIFKILFPLYPARINIFGMGILNNNQLNKI